MRPKFLLTRPVKTTGVEYPGATLARVQSAQMMLALGCVWDVMVVREHSISKKELIQQKGHRS